MHPNARLIEKLYSSLRDDKPDAAAACYAGDAHFEDIAFWLNGRDCILQMWRLVCSQKVRVSFDSVVADDQHGGANWVAKYTITETRRKVTNPTTAHFDFRDGLIVNHVDRCDAMAWATQAFPSLSILPSARSNRSGGAWPATNSSNSSRTIGAVTPRDYSHNDFEAGRSPHRTTVNPAPAPAHDRGSVRGAGLGGQPPEIGHGSGEFRDALQMALERGRDGERAPIPVAPAAHLNAERHAGVIAPARDARDRMRRERQAIGQRQPVEVGAQALAVDCFDVQLGMRERRHRHRRAEQRIVIGHELEETLVEQRVRLHRPCAVLEAHGEALLDIGADVGAEHLRPAAPGLHVPRQEVDRAGDLERLVGAVIQRRVAVVGASERAAEAGNGIAEHPPDAIVDRGEAEILTERDAQTAQVDRLERRGGSLRP